MCGGFKFSKNALISLNIFYILVGFLLIGVATYYKASNLVASLPIIGGIVACGIFLLIIAILGLVGTIKHHQVTLFFYMLVLFLLFIIQFSVSIACLVVDDATQKNIAEAGWKAASNETKHDVESLFKCCGFRNSTDGIDCKEEWKQQSCFDTLEDIIGYAFRASGGVGLFFSFTEILGFTIAYRFRNMATGLNEVQ